MVSVHLCVINTGHEFLMILTSSFGFIGDSSTYETMFILPGWMPII